MIVSAAPRFSARAQSSTEFMKRIPAFTPPSTSNAINAPPEVCCLWANSNWGNDSKPGYEAEATHGCAVRYCAIRKAFAECWAIRKGKVFTPCNVSQAGKGD